MPASAARHDAILAAMAANRVPPAGSGPAYDFYASMYDMILTALGAAQVAPGLFVAPPGTAGGPVQGFGGPIT